MFRKMRISMPNPKYKQETTFDVNLPINPYLEFSKDELEDILTSKYIKDSLAIVDLTVKNVFNCYVKTFTEINANKILIRVKTSEKIVFKGHKSLKKYLETLINNLIQHSFLNSCLERGYASFSWNEEG